MKRNLLPCKEREFAKSAFLNAAANFHQSLSPIVGYKPKYRQGLLIKDIQELAKNLSWIRWFQVLYVSGQGLVMIDRLLTVSLVAEKL